MRDGTYLILAGPPKERDPCPKIAQDSEVLLTDCVEEYKSKLAAQAQRKAE